MGRCIYLRKGEVHTALSADILASKLAIGQVVKLMENNVATDFIVVQQGLPSEAYDASCNGTWLLRKNLYNIMFWQHPYDSEKFYDWETCSANTWLNNTYYNLLGSVEQTVVKAVNIPVSATYNVTDKVFWLGGTEVGFVGDSDFASVGAKLAYFDENSQYKADPKRVVTTGGVAQEWWLRSQRSTYDKQAFYIKTDGSSTYASIDNISKGNRPCLVIPSTSKFDKDTLILKS